MLWKLIKIELYFGNVVKVWKSVLEVINRLRAWNWVFRFFVDIIFWFFFFFSSFSKVLLINFFLFLVNRFYDI